MIYICKLQSHVIDCQSSNQEEKEGKKFTSVGEGASATENTQYFGEWSLASDEMGLRRLVSMPKSYAEIAVRKKNWLFWTNSRRMVAVTSASSKLLWWQPCFVSIVCRWMDANLTLAM